jgi:hypothetical protein
MRLGWLERSGYVIAKRHDGAIGTAALEKSEHGYLVARRAARVRFLLIVSRSTPS